MISPGEFAIHRAQTPPIWRCDPGHGRNRHGGGKRTLGAMELHLDHEILRKPLRLLDLERFAGHHLTTHACRARSTRARLIRDSGSQLSLLDPLTRPMMNEDPTWVRQRRAFRLCCSFALPSQTSAPLVVPLHLTSEVTRLSPESGAFAHE